MKHFLLLSILFVVGLSSVEAQKKTGPAEKKMTDNICNCMSTIDMATVTSKQIAEKAFADCFTKEPALILEVANERKLEITDHPAMRQLGIDIGKNLLAQNCKGFMQLSLAMADNADDNAAKTGETEGKLKRLETKDFNYFVLTGTDNNEKSFIWLRQFPGSENFTNNAGKYTGKKLKISWQEIEVYIPSAKNYYNIKEVTAIEVLN